MQRMQVKEVFAYSEVVGGAFHSRLAKESLDIVFVRHFHNKWGGERCELVYAEGSGQALSRDHPLWQEACAYLTSQCQRQNFQRI